MTPLRRVRLLFALASGIFLALGFAPFDAPVVAWISVAALVLSVLGARPWVAALGGFLHGMAFYLLSVPWIYSVMRVHGHLSPTAAGGVLVLMVAVLSLFPAAFAWAVNRIHTRAGAKLACLAAPFLWVATEYARAHMPDLAFPWNFLGYAVADHLGLLQLASLGGIYLISLVVAAYNALFAYLLLERTRRAWIAWLVASGILLPLFAVGFRYVPSPAIPSRVAHLVQPNLPQTTSYGDDWFARYEADLAEIEMLTITAAQTHPGLVIWPEVPAPFYLRDAAFAARAARIAQQSGSHFLLGVVEWKPGAGKWDGPYNSAVLLDPAGKPVFSYDKIHLVPFGEYVPWGRLLSFAGDLTAEVSSFKSGGEPRVGQWPDRDGAQHKFGVFICYEAIFPNEVRRFTANGAELLVNLSNDAWFGRSAAPEQHLALARVRAVENRRWLLRVTNNGHTVAVDPYGRIVVRIEPDRRGVLAAPYDFRSDRTLYSLLGDWAAWLSLLVGGWFIFKSRGKARTDRP